jgi:hypothetical protein
MAVFATDIDWLQVSHGWPGLGAIGKVVRSREIGEKTTTETACYLLSLDMTGERLNDVVRSHRGDRERPAG